MDAWRYSVLPSAKISADQRSLPWFPFSLGPARHPPKIAVDDASEASTCFACSAGVAQLVEHHLAKVDVESSSLFARSILGKPPETLPAVFSSLIVANRTEVNR